MREALPSAASRQLVLQTQTHNADLVPENQPWYQVQQVVDGELDVAGVWGPFAGWVKT